MGRTLRIGGWVRTGREAGAGAFAFLEVSDGSCFGNIQARGLGCLPPAPVWHGLLIRSSLGLGRR